MISEVSLCQPDDWSDALKEWFLIGGPDPRGLCGGVPSDVSGNILSFVFGVAQCIV